MSTVSMYGGQLGEFVSQTHKSTVILQNQHRFQLGDMDDAAECFVSLHIYFYGF